MRRTVAVLLAVALCSSLAFAAEGELEAGFRKPPAACRPTAGWFHTPAFAAAVKACPEDVRPAFERALADGGLSTTPEEAKRMAAWQALTDVSVITPPGMPGRPPSQPYAALAGPLADFTARLVFMGSKTEPVGGIFTQAKAAHGIAIYPPAPGLYLARRRLGNADVYLAISQLKIDTVCTITFPRVATPELWDPEDGSIRDATAYYVRGKSTALNLRLGPYQALFIVLRKPPSKQHVMFAPTLKITAVEPDGSAVHGLARLNGRCSVMFANGNMKTAVVKGLPPALPIAAGWAMTTRTPAERAGVGIAEIRWLSTSANEEKPKLWASPTFDDSKWEAQRIGGPREIAVGGVPWRANWLVFEGNNEVRLFRKAVELPEDPNFATVTLSADNGYELFVNGQRLGADGNWNAAETYNALKALRKGKNVLAVRNTNQGSVGGLLLEARIRLASGQLIYVVTDGTWKMTNKAPEGWEKPDFDDAKWGKPTVKGRPPVAPWGDVKGLPEPPVGGQLTWFRFPLPPGTTSLRLPAGLKEPRLYVNGKEAGVRGGVADLTRMAVGDKAVAALRAIGSAILDQPILCKCAGQQIGVGNWLMVGYPTYSGLANYTVSFDLPAAYKKERLILDLGQVGCAGTVTLNDKAIGTRLWRPYAFDITDAVREGKNTLKITVANTAANASGKAIAAERLAGGILGPVLIRPLRPIAIQAQ